MFQRLGRGALQQGARLARSTGQRGCLFGKIQSTDWRGLSSFFPAAPRLSLPAVGAGCCALFAAALAHAPHVAQGQGQELEGMEDMFGGVLINAQTLPTSASVFHQKLTAALASWKAAGKKGVWLKLKPEHATLLATAYAHGFEMHHANKCAMVLVKWLPDTPSTVPQPASHYVGVGVAVIDDQHRILVVQEKFGAAAASRRGKDFWKMPTGLVDNGEDIETAAVREVFEETGVRVRFDGVLAFRQNHKTGVEGKTDLFFLCKATPLSHDITIQVMTEGLGFRV